MMRNFELSSFVVPLLVLVSGVCGLKIPFERRAPKGASVSAASGDLENRADVRYIANITVNGVENAVMIDTGSTDLWIKGSIGSFNDSQIPLELRYGDGTYGVSGTIGVAPFKFGPYEVSNQAFLYVQKTIGNLGDMGAAGLGLLGLSFDLASASPIKKKVQELYGSSAAWGNSVLYNIFSQNPTHPNVVGIHLARTADLEQTEGGSFSIGEYDPDYSAVTSAPKLTQFPVNGDRWTTLIEGIYIDGKSIPLKSRLQGVPDGQLLALVDSGAPTGIFPVSVWNAIYSSIPGGVRHGDWFVPCNATALVEIAFRGVKYPIHPLDLTNITSPHNVNGHKVVSCVSAFDGSDTYGRSSFEVILGASFMRNVYSLFDFGDPGTPDYHPYMQFLSTTDPKKAISEVATIRGRTLGSLPPEIPPESLPSSSDNGTDASSFSAEDDRLYTTLGVDTEGLKTYGLVALGLLGTNLLIGLILLGLAVMTCVRRGLYKRGLRRGPQPASVATEYEPIKIHEDPGSTYPTRYDCH